MTSRIDRERGTVEIMISLYCRHFHSKDNSCDCRQLLDYALERLRKCTFQEGKTTCVRCPVHCYKPEMRDKIRLVMRFAGPRMLYLHPILTIYHLIDGRRKKPLNLS
jgi:hypothetical protein